MNNPKIVVHDAAGAFIELQDQRAANGDKVAPFRIALCLLDQGLNREAAAKYDQVLDGLTDEDPLAPVHLWAQLTEARILMATNDHQMALEVIMGGVDSALASSSADVEVTVLLLSEAGRIYQTCIDTEGAAPLYGVDPLSGARTMRLISCVRQVLF